MSQIKSLAYQTGRSVEETRRYNRTPMDTLELIEGHGIQGDIKAGKHRRRQLNVMSREVLNHLAELGYHTAPGEMGEQLVLEGVDFSSLKAGMQLQLGDDAIIELTMKRVGCAWLEMVQGRPAIKETKAKLGFMAKVIKSGKIQVDDPVKILIHEQTN